MKQTISYKLNPTNEQAKHLANLGFYATKLYNTDNYQRRKAWEETGKIPNAYAQKKELKENVWFKLLPSQTAQEVCFVLQQNYKSWFQLKKVDKLANPPRFRKKKELSTLSFYGHNKQLKIENNKFIISLSRKYKKEQGISKLEIEFEAWKTLDGQLKMCQLIYKNGEWFANIVYEVADKQINLNENVRAIDLGIINLASAVDNSGKSNIYSGKQALAVQHYFNSRKARVTSKLTKQFPKRYKSKTLNNLNKKQSRQINQIIHTISKKIVDDAKRDNISVLVIGDIKNIRKLKDKSDEKYSKGKNFGKVNNQKLHFWSFSKITQQIEYKATLSGIRVVRVSEEYTSQTCSCCNAIRKSNRKHRGLYVCKFCGRIINADINGAVNILKKYLQMFSNEQRSIGDVELPIMYQIKNVI
ncbi:MAG: transposase [Nanoarchaeota archaeon]